MIVIHGKKRVSNFTLIAIITLAGRYLQAATYYVATNGNDSAAGTLAAPWKTLSHACSTASAAGSVIQLGAGTFWETSQSHPASGVTIAGQGVDQTIVSGSASMANASGSYGSFGWTETCAMIVLSQQARGNTISNLTLDGNHRALQAGVALTRLATAAWNNYSQDATNIVIHDVNFQNFTCMGLWLEEVQNAQVYNCNFTECATDDPSTVLGALNLGGVRDSQIYNCNVTNLTTASGYGIKLFDRPVQNTVMYDINVVVKPGSIWSGGGTRSGTGYAGNALGNCPNFAMEAAHEVLINVEMYNLTLINGAFSIVLDPNSAHNGTPYYGTGYALRFHDSRIQSDYGWLIELSGSAIKLDHDYFASLMAGGAYVSFANYFNSRVVFRDLVLHHNVIAGVGNHVFSSSAGLTNFQFCNNTVVYAANGSAAPSALSLKSGSSYNHLNFINNIFYRGGAVGSGSLLSGAGTTAPGLVYSNNCNFNVPFANPGGGAAYGGNITVDPGLTLGAAAKPLPYYQPLSPSSPVVDAGQVISGITTNYFGAAPDIGAYELIPPKF